MQTRVWNGTMNENPFDSLISAYFDGELHDADRDAVDERLADDADARQELAEYGQLSVLLRDLDRTPLPEEFTAQVMQRLERRTLLPQPQIVPRRGSWGWSALVPLAATAAVLLLMWAYPRRNPDPLIASSDHFGTHDYAESTNGALGGGNEQFFERNLALRSGAGGLGGPGSDAIEGKQVLRRSGAAVAPMGVEMPAPAEPISLASDTPIFEAQNARDHSALTSFGFTVKPQDFEVGNVVEAIETSPTRVAVVKLWVVDRQEGLDKLQLLLARNDVVADDDMGVSNGVVVANRAADKQAKRLSAEGESLTEAEQLKAPLPVEKLDGVSTSDGLVAIYVEAPKQKLAEVLKGLQTDHAFVEVKAQLGMPTQLAQLERRAGESDARGEKSAEGHLQLGRNLNQALGDNSGAGSGVRKGSDALSAKPGNLPSKPPAAARPAAGGSVADGQFADASGADESERELRRKLSGRSRFKVIDNARELREVTADDLAKTKSRGVESAAKGQVLKESIENRSEPAREPAAKKYSAEDAKAVVSGPLHVIFLVQQAAPRK